MTQTNPRILTNIITNISQTRFKQDVFNELNKLYGRNYEHNNYTVQLIKSARDTVTLGIPKVNSLTDSLMKTTFGCEQKLAKSYLSILDKSTMIEEQQKQKKIQEAKIKFMTANNFKDFCANSKPYMKTSKLATKRILPVIDNQHDSYLKTHLMFLQGHQGGVKVNEKQYFQKHIDNVAKKINQIGGMEDTVKNMEESLSRNQIKNFKKRSIITTNKDSSYTASKLQNKKDSVNIGGNSWIERSKIIRKTLMNKFNIE